MKRDKAAPAKSANSTVTRLLIYIAIMNLMQGVAHLTGIPNQIVSYYLKSLGFQPDQVAWYLTWPMVPFIIKPVYGLIADRVRRRPGLIITIALGTVGFVWLAAVLSPTPLLVALVLSQLGLAASNTLSETMLVQEGNRLGMSGRFLNFENLWFNGSSIVSTLLAGWLVDHTSAGTALHVAAWICVVLQIAVVLASWLLVDESQAPAHANQKDAAAPAGEIQNRWWTSKLLWLAALFLFVWNIAPNPAVPLYFYMTDNLHFSQVFIGFLSAMIGLGSVAGGLLYEALSRRLGLIPILYLGRLLMAVGVLSWVFMSGTWSAIAVNVLNGITGTVALVGSLAIAANASSGTSTGTVFALLMSENYLTGLIKKYAGAWLAVHVFAGHMAPLIYLAAGLNIAAAVVIPMMKPVVQDSNLRSEES